jgi:hypothetical protein
METLEMKSSMSQIKSTVESLSNRLDIVKKETSKLGDWSFEISQSDKRKTRKEYSGLPRHHDMSSS